VLGDPVEDLTLAQAADEERLDARGDLAVGVERGARAMSRMAVSPAAIRCSRISAPRRSATAGALRRCHEAVSATTTRSAPAVRSARNAHRPSSSSPASGSMIVTVLSRA
jgi:hypothetical protein